VTCVHDVFFAYELVSCVTPVNFKYLPVQLNILKSFKHLGTLIRYILHRIYRNVVPLLGEVGTVRADPLGDSAGFAVYFSRKIN
jgi:hypothetical protein